MLSQGALVDAIIPLISRNEELDDRSARDGIPLLPDPTLPLRRIYIDDGRIPFSKVLRNYLISLKDIAGVNWEAFVLRSLGIRVFMRVLGHFAKIGLEKNDLTSNFFAIQLNLIRAEILECSTGGGTNKRTENEIFGRLILAFDIAEKAKAAVEEAAAAGANGAQASRGV